MANEHVHLTEYRLLRSHYRQQELMYDRHWIDEGLPFQSLQEQSWINDIANAAPIENFSTSKLLLNPTWVRAICRPGTEVFNR